MNPREVKIALLVHLLNSNLSYYFNYNKFNIIFHVNQFRFIDPTLKELSAVLHAGRIKEIKQCLTVEELTKTLQTMLNYYVNKKEPATEDLPLFPNVVFRKEDK
jgi:hypothetical protein